MDYMSRSTEKIITVLGEISVKLDLLIEQTKPEEPKPNPKPKPKPPKKPKR